MESCCPAVRSSADWDHRVHSTGMVPDMRLKRGQSARLNACFHHWAIDGCTSEPLASVPTAAAILDPRTAPTSSLQPISTISATRPS